ncbi:UNVERIFIED_CONTAM: hypothetical protein HDU68_003924 [Siphonaria sp. JEL0065]|nr:hypothetical protein HDU68_003924 [Siphonaria sp. JEL0065]
MESKKNSKRLNFNPETLVVMPFLSQVYVATDLRLAKLHDCIVRPKGAIADAIIDQATRIDIVNPPAEVCFQIVEMIKEDPVVGSQQVVEAIFFNLYSDSNGAFYLFVVFSPTSQTTLPGQIVHVHHTLVVLDILYRNCGINFVHNFSRFADLICNFCESKNTSQENLELFLGMIAAWQSIEIECLVPVPQGWNQNNVDAIKKMRYVCLELQSKGYPFNEKALDGVVALETKPQYLGPAGKYIKAAKYHPRN